nr:protein kinase [Planctomycetota bacterium]
MAYMEVIKDGKVVKRKPMDDAVAERGCVINLGKIGKARLAVGESAKIGEYRVRVCSGEMPPEPLASRKTLVDRSPDVLDAAGAGREEPPVKFPKIEGFRVTGQLGAGGMGAVWRAVQLSTQREVALKILHVGRFGSKRARIRFEREVELAARLEHPNIARVYDSGLHHNDYYYAMELVDGAGLDKYVETNNLTPKQVFALIRTICRAIAHAHGFGVIHRDLKPSNILVTPDGQPHVLDFGLAKTLEPDESSIQVSIEGETSGTPAFMSPEQAAGHHSKVDGRTDVYSLGVITFRLLTGEYPHEMSGSHFEIIRRIVETEARRPRDLSETIDREIEAILLKALAHDKDDRYDTADQMADDIGNYLSGKPIMARAPMPLYRLRKAARRNRTALLIGAAVALLIAGIALFAYHKISDAERARTTGHDRLAKERGTEAERVAQLEKLLEENKAKSAQSEAEWNRRLAAAKTDKERAELLAAKAREDAARQARLNETAPKVPKVQQTTTIAGAEFMGDWQGTRKVSGNRSPIVAQVIALGNGQHRANILGEFDKRAPPIEVLTGNTQGRKLILSGGGWTAEIENGKFTGSGGGCTFEMTRTTRLSPTIGAKPPQKAIVLLGSNTTDLDTQWKSARGDGACTWNLLPGGVMRSVLKSGSIISRQDFGDHRIHLEFRTMFKPNSKGQKRSNSGVYVQGRLEVQVLDSYGLEGKFDECGAIYKMAAPLVNMCAPPLQWQTYDIDFKAAEMDGKKIVKPARINVIHNGVKIHDNLELTRHSEQAISSGIGPRGGLYLQEFGSVVEYRNIWVTESKNVPGNVNTGQTAQ